MYICGYLVLKKQLNKKVIATTKRTTLATAATKPVSRKKATGNSLYQYNNVSAAATQVV
jgi:hypothetical protein